VRGFHFRDLEFVPVQPPKAVRGRQSFKFGVTEQRHGGGVVLVTTLERTLVDVLDVPPNAGGWEEIWRSLEMVEFFDLDAVVAYALKLGSALTVARVGLYLELHRDALMVSDAHLAKLRKHRPRQPRYLDGSREPGTLVQAWNLIVPERVTRRAWAEVA
jgi:predicted transcriptional regulator of viral defense system